MEKKGNISLESFEKKSYTEEKTIKNNLRNGSLELFSLLPLWASVLCNPCLRKHCSFLKYYITSDMHCLIPQMLGGCLYLDVYFT